MKNLFLFVFALAIQGATAQVDKNLADFSTLKVFDKLQVQLIASTENRITITGEREDEVELIQKNGELKIRMPFPKLLSGDATTITLYYTNLNAIDASEGALVTSNETFKASILDLNVKEGAEISLKLDLDKVRVKAVTGGSIVLTGKASNQVAVLTTGGMLESKDLHTQQTTITISAGGNAAVYATTLVDAKVKAGGTVLIFGKPKQINKETTFGGTIKEKN
ncbi:head GIN domain-containing protein [Flavobacterium crassostreae]|uniref:Chaperonin n=1 Tax=Flavobacterium crassostreae TaxID=1763534 RepID=A0A1B9E5H9_9FLAO|nr:head GIN domain-containing protein [Flavobacterium crassostreae]OCB77195.1 chaperonin [Flavobacterium crassostreae]